jgi:hypothetical protein
MLNDSHSFEGQDGTTSKFKSLLFLDWYGDGSRRDPRRHPKSYTGAIFTIFAVVSCSVLIGFSIRDYAARYENVRIGGRSQLNGLFKSPDSSVLNDTSYLVQSWPDFLVPSLELSFRTSIISYDSLNRSSVFKVEIVDNTGFQRTLTSSQAQTPVGYAIDNTHQV